MRPFSLRIFVPSGDPTGVLIATRDDGIGKATLFSRPLLGEVKGRKEWSFPGVYLLAGQSKLYIGEGDPVGKRLEEHATKKVFWNRALFFTAENRLNKAHIQHLESRLIKLAVKAETVALDNGNQPQPPALGEEEYAFAENVLADMLLTLPLLGYTCFEPAEPTLSEGDSSESDDDGATLPLLKGSRVYSELPLGLIFRCSYKEARAAIELVESGVEVKSGSTIVREPAPSFDVWRPGYAQLRRQLIASGVVAEKNGQLAFVQDQFFTSASAAASIVCGVSSNADIWNSDSNQSLGDLLRSAKRK
ncbi:GIY-YIG nuclease family protein [Burkholderia lata]|uniref:Excinuclease ABC subunit C n=1 Tax=Burkholderia lata (strain ATCC 17760 / DSM 23089 / LMG 22485 / NCIMB 9086 / R18194 / 383) TaxID=482957 RepID=A0A6P2SZ54_BURL3|nr:GIY-YIG nuclease family protein [Burkholderia lata]VWC48877.1 excinuclease ABC subunit C [Burkholderia lata]